MSPATLTQSQLGAPSGAARDDLSEGQEQELLALRAALDARLAALEAALADPDHSGSIEALILDLARVATEEAAASTRRAIVDAQVDVQARAAHGWMEVQTSLATERSASIVLRREIEQAQAALQAERAVGGALGRDLEAEKSAVETARADGAIARRRLDEVNAALDRERADSAELRQSLEQAEQRIAEAEDQIAQAEQRIEVVEAEKLAEVRKIHDQSTSDLLRERGAVSRLTDTLTELRAELAAAVKDVGARTGEVEAARGRADAIEEQLKEVEQSLRTAEARYAEAVLERDSLALELEAARQETGTISADARARLDAIETDRRNLDRAREDTAARLEQAILERDALALELEVARQETGTISADARARLDAIETDRKNLERAREDTNARLEQTILERDALAGDLEAARQEIGTITADALARLDAFETDRNQLERARADTNARLERAILERDAVARELEAVREETGTTSADARARFDAIETDRKNLERVREDTEARLAQAILERDALARELEAARQETGTTSAAARAHADAVEAERASLEQACEQAGRRLEMAARDRESLAAELVSLREALRAAQDEAHAQYEQQVSAVEGSNQADVRLAHEQFASELSRERAAGMRLMETLEQRERELAIALDNAGLRAAEVDAVRQQADALDWQRKELERAAKETEARCDAAILERDALARELETARQETSAATAAALARVDALEADRTNLEQARQRAETRLEILTSDRGTLNLELESLTSELEVLRQTAGVAKKASRAPALHALRAGQTGDERPPKPSEHVATRSDRPLRRTMRQTFDEEIRIQIDARPGLLVDLSKYGAQVISQTTLKPNRVVKIQLPGENGTVTCRGKIVWARVEPSDTRPSLRYRAGVCFTTVDETAVVAFMAANPGRQAS